MSQFLSCDEVLQLLAAEIQAPGGAVEPPAIKGWSMARLDRINREGEARLLVQHSSGVEHAFTITVAG